MEKEKVQEVILGNMSINKQELIKQAKNAYYNSDTPIMSDAEYDLLVKQVGYESVGSPVLKELKKIKIEGKPMLSLEKCHSVEEIIDFAQGQDLVASIKCDGLSVRIIYEDGIIVSANTRGDGEIGQDITEHIKQFKNVPFFFIRFCKIFFTFNKCHYRHRHPTNKHILMKQKHCLIMHTSFQRFPFFKAFFYIFFFLISWLLQIMRIYVSSIFYDYTHIL